MFSRTALTATAQLSSWAQSALRTLSLQPPSPHGSVGHWCSRDLEICNNSSNIPGAAVPCNTMGLVCAAAIRRGSSMASRTAPSPEAPEAPLPPTDAGVEDVTQPSVGSLSSSCWSCKHRFKKGGIVCSGWIGKLPGVHAVLRVSILCPCFSVPAFSLPRPTFSRVFLTLVLVPVTKRNRVREDPAARHIAQLL